MSEIPTRSEILADSSENGLMAYLFGIATTHPILYREKEFLATVSELVNSGNSTLFAEKNWAFLDGIETGSSDFFSGMYLLCELIPTLDVGHRDIMRLTDALVHLGGKDLAASHPNSAFLKWCGADPARVETVIQEAKTGDSLAMAHLVFALEAGEESSSAIMFLNENSEPAAQLGAIVALRSEPPRVCRRPVSLSHSDLHDLCISSYYISQNQPVARCPSPNLRGIIILSRNGVSGKSGAVHL